MAAIDDDKLAAWMTGVDNALADGSRRMQDLEKSQQANNLMTADIHELMELGRTGFKVLNWIGRAFTAVAKWVAPIAAAIAAVYAALYAIKTGHPPPKP